MRKKGRVRLRCLKYEVKYLKAGPVSEELVAVQERDVILDVPRT